MAENPTNVESPVGAKKPHRRRFQFRLRTLMLGVTLLAVPYLRRMAGEDHS